MNEVKLKTHKRLYKLLHVEENESMVNLFTRVTRLINHIKMYREVMITNSIIAKISRPLLPKFDHIVVSVEESNDFSSLTKEDLQGTFESHAQRMWRGLQARQKLV